MGATCGAGNAHSFQKTSDFTPFGEFMISPIHYYIIYALQNLSVLRLCLWIIDSGLFAWISLTALSCELFYIHIIIINQAPKGFARLLILPSVCVCVFVCVSAAYHPLILDGFL